MLHTGALISAPSAQGSIYSGKPPLSPGKPGRLTIESLMGSNSPSRQVVAGEVSTTRKDAKSGRSQLKEPDLDQEIKKHFNIHLDKIEEEEGDELT